MYRAIFCKGKDMLFSSDKALAYVVEQAAIVGRNRLKTILTEPPYEFHLEGSHVYVHDIIVARIEKIEESA